MCERIFFRRLLVTQDVEAEPCKWKVFENKLHNNLPQAEYTSPTNMANAAAEDKHSVFVLFETGGRNNDVLDSACARQRPGFVCV